MSKGVNKCIIIGALGKDPEMHYTANGTAIATMSVATSEQWKDKEGNKQESTEWHRIKAFGKLAEICGEYLKKGSQAYFEGKIKTHKWTDQSGADKYSTEIEIREMQMLGKKGEAIQPADHVKPEPKPQEDDFLDDIPF